MLCVFCAKVTSLPKAALNPVSPSYFDIRGLAAPPRVSQFLEIVNSLSVPFIHKPTRPGSHPNHLLYQDLPLLGQYPPARITPGPGARQPGTAPVPQSQLNYSNQPTLSLCTSAHPGLPVKSAVEALAHTSPSLCLLMDRCLPKWPCVMYWNPSSWELEQTMVSMAIVYSSVGLTIPEWQEHLHFIIINFRRRKPMF